jgi:hypothetical protein
MVAPAGCGQQKEVAMRRVVAVGALVVALAAGAWAQPGPGGDFPPQPGRLLGALVEELAWLQGLSIEAPGWTLALGSLEEALAELEEDEGAPSPVTMLKLNAALDLTISILERTAFQHLRERVREEAPPGPPTWLEEYLNEATAGMGVEEAARVRAIVHGLLRGLQLQLAEEVRERAGEGRQMSPRGRPQPEARPRLPEEVRDWIHGYLAGATAGMGKEQAQQVREIAWGAVRAGFQFHQERREQREENLRHFLRLKGIAAGLDVLVLRELAG